MSSSNQQHQIKVLIREESEVTRATILKCVQRSISEARYAPRLSKAIVETECGDDDIIMIEKQPLMKESFGVKRRSLGLADKVFAATKAHEIERPQERYLTASIMKQYRIVKTRSQKPIM